jgi:hypothetical protein
MLIDGALMGENAGSQTDGYVDGDDPNGSTVYIAGEEDEVVDDT